MRRLHLKLFYLRTRFKREPQGVTAKKLGVRPATMSHLEQGRSLPTLPMLDALCRHYDVTPTYLLDDSRPIEPQVRDRWSEREAQISRGDWLEVPDGAALKTADGTLLCPVMGGARFYGSNDHAQRMLCQTSDDASALESKIGADNKERDTTLEEMLRNELLAQRKPRSKSKVRVADNGILKQARGHDADGGRLAAEA
ncbi:MAG: helix-turn-helix transcriptional regulator [Planctomycetes bacterium]|nr:helix-turn-helix transcriptional regulator [Planctomycetota bacterium]